MRTFQITLGQKESITKPKKYHGINFQPRQDINGKWFIWEVEMRFCMENFGWTPVEAIFVAPPGDEAAAL